MSTLSLTQQDKKVLPAWLSIGLGALLFFVCANFKIFLPISFVPITMHTFAIFMLAALLPFRHAVVSMLSIYALGFLQMPFFTSFVIAPMCVGYYVGWLAALFLISQLKNKVSLLPLLLFSSYLILGLGFFHLQFIFGVSKAWKIGVMPFLIGDTFKACLAYFLLKGLQKKSFSHPC